MQGFLTETERLSRENISLSRKIAQITVQRDNFFRCSLSLQKEKMEWLNKEQGYIAERNRLEKLCESQNACLLQYRAELQEMKEAETFKLIEETKKTGE